MKLLEIAARYRHGDKALHAVVGLAIYLPTWWALGPDPALLAVFVAGIGKEIYDAQHRDRHTPDVLDALATVALPVFLWAWALWA